MNFIEISSSEGIAEVILNRPKVNALNEIVVEELKNTFDALSKNNDAKAVILSGSGSFFSFGFDVPELYSYPREEFTRFVVNFSDLLKKIFLFPKPVVGALNGHAIAGGACIAISCDYGLMVAEKAKISFNEITFGSTLFSTIVEMLKFLVGGSNTSRIIYFGKMYEAKEALGLGLIDQVASKDGIKEKAKNIAIELSKINTDTFKSVKFQLRKPTVERIEKSEHDSVLEFVDLWYSESTRKKLQMIRIRD